MFGAICTCWDPQRPEVLNPSEVGVSRTCESPDMVLNPNSGPLEEQYTLLATEPSLHPKRITLFCFWVFFVCFAFFSFCLFCFVIFGFICVWLFCFGDCLFA